MTRLSLVVAVSLLFSSPAFSQTAPPGGSPTVRPPATGAPVPGMPSRDANRPVTPQTGTGRIRGRVMAAQTGQPLRRAQVNLTMEGNIQNRRSTTTDADGYFQFNDLPAGRFTATASKAGYVTLQFGQRRPFETGTPVTLGDGGSVENVNFAMPKGGVIAVRVTDEFGEPVAGISLEVMRFTYGQDGRRRLAAVPGGGGGLGSGTDDRGELRMYGLMPGEYVVRASMRFGGSPVSAGNDAAEGFAPTYYPGTVSADEAQAVSLAVGQELPIQLSMAASRLLTISGTVVDSEGAPAAGASLSVITATENSMSSSGAGQVRPDGSFLISGVAPGERFISVSLARTGRPNEGASLPVTVGGGDLAGVRITTSPGAIVSGRVVFEGTAPRPQTIRVRATQFDPQRRMASIGLSSDPLNDGRPKEDGAFTLGGVLGTVFFELLPVPPGWMLKRVTQDGQDITDVPMNMEGRGSLSNIEIVLTDKLPVVSGQVTDARGAPVRDYVVVIQAADAKEPLVASRWIRVVRPDTSGRFENRGLRPGRYVATAIEALEQGREYSPEFQQQLRRTAREFTVDEGQTATLDLRLTPDL